MAILAATDGVALGAASTAGAGPLKVLSAKLAPPPLAYATVLRRRPLALLSRAVQRLPLTLISGPAGSGKTVLATCWANAEPAGRTIAWLTLDDYDNEPWIFWTYMIRALDRAGVAVPEVPPLVSGESPPGQPPHRSRAGAPRERRRRHGRAPGSRRSRRSRLPLS